MELFFKWYNLQVIESLNQQHELSFDTDDNLSKKNPCYSTEGKIQAQIASSEILYVVVVASLIPEQLNLSKK